MKSVVSITLLFLLVSCKERVKDVCCTTDADCAMLGLPSGSVGTHGCEEGFACSEFHCVLQDSIDAGPAANGRCIPKAPFGTPMLLKGVNTGFDEISLALTSKELTAYMARDVQSSFELVTTSRATREDDFPAPKPDPNLANVVGGLGNELKPWPARDDLLLYFERQGRAFVAQRMTPSDAFDAGIAIAVENTDPATIHFVQTDPDALNIYWTGDDNLLRVAPGIAGPPFFGSASQISTMPVALPLLSADALTLFYVPIGQDDIYVSTRPSTSAAFDPGTIIPTLSAGTNNTPLFLTADGCLLYTTSTGAGGTDIWVSRRPK